jgi:hypothetical protein
MFSKKTWRSPASYRFKQRFAIRALLLMPTSVAEQWVFRFVDLVSTEGQFRRARADTSIRPRRGPFDTRSQRKGRCPWDRLLVGFEAKLLSRRQRVFLATMGVAR